MNALASVYLRGHTVVVAPRGGGGGVTYETEPVRVLPSEENPVQEAVLQSLHGSEAHMGKHIYDFRDVKKTGAGKAENQLAQSSTRTWPSAGFTATRKGSSFSLGALHTTAKGSRSPEYRAWSRTRRGWARSFSRRCARPEE